MSKIDRNASPACYIVTWHNGCSGLIILRWLSKRLQGRLKCQDELCHGKTCLKIFVVAIPKESLTDRALQSFSGYDTDYKIVLCCFHRLYSVVGVIPKEGLAGPCPPILLLVSQRQRSQGTFSHDTSQGVCGRLSRCPSRFRTPYISTCHLLGQNMEFACWRTCSKLMHVAKDPFPMSVGYCLCTGRNPYL